MVVSVYLIEWLSLKEMLGEKDGRSGVGSSLNTYNYPAVKVSFTGAIRF